MLRVILLGILVAAASPSVSCSKDGATPAASASAVVGKVAAISGKVEAIHEGKPRELVLGAEIFGDDEVIVSADGSIGIDLAHNNARWSLESGRRGKVRESLAWTMAKVDTPSKPVEHATSAAGREGERSAATSSTTEVAASAAAPATETVPTKADDATAAPTPTPQKATKPKAPTRGKSGGASGGENEGFGGLGLSGTGPGGGGTSVGIGIGGGSIGGKGGSLGGGGAAPGAPAPRETTRGPVVTNTKPPMESPRAPDMDKSAPPPPPPPAQPQPDAEDAKRREAITKTIYAQKATLQKCAGSKGLKLNITVKTGAATMMIVGGKASDETIKCIEKALQQLKLQHATPLAVILEL